MIFCWADRCVDQVWQSVSPTRLIWLHTQAELDWLDQNSHLYGSLVTFSCFCALRLLCNRKIARHKISDQFPLHLTTKSVCRINKQVTPGSTDLFYYRDSTWPIFKLTRPILWLWWSGIRFTVHELQPELDPKPEKAGRFPVDSSVWLDRRTSLSIAPPSHHSKIKLKEGRMQGQHYRR